MQQQICQKEGHDEEEVYVCNELKCIELKENKLLCQKCLCLHKGMHFKKLKENANVKCTQYINSLQNDLDHNEELKKNVDQQIQQIQGKIFQTLSDLKKNIVSYVDQQSAILQQNKNQAEKLMLDQNPQIDLYIYFGKLSNENFQNKLDINKQQIKKLIDTTINELNFNIDYINQPDIQKHKVMDYDLQQFTLESIFQQQLPYEYCGKHFAYKSSICTHSECLNQKNLTYHCLRCSKSLHVEHFQNDYLLEYEQLKEQQKAKCQFFLNEKLTIYEKFQQLVNQQISQLRQEQKKQYQSFEITIENIKILEQQFQKSLFVQDINYVFGDLLLNLITTEEKELNQQLNNQFQTFVEQLQLCKIQEKPLFVEKCKNIQSHENEIQQLKKQISGLQQEISDMDQTLDNCQQYIQKCCNKQLKIPDNQIQPQRKRYK
ncbi:unnamed protein product [Paramecium sonneborni]|uniref:Uncharacterized protein n=1 Tax=Paramecium sonneborni TaxID=65129 RepID=A0A8S1RGR4_9CILI|nr:unnamed protein product [Paramecium sonneborni]